MRFLLGIAMFLVGMLVFHLINAHWHLTTAVAPFADAPTVMGFGIVISAVIVATGQANTFVSGIKAAFSKRHNLSEDERIRAIGMFKLLRKTVVYAAILFSSMTMVFILGNLQDWDTFAANTALAMLSVYYAALINIILINPVISILERRNEQK